MKPCCPEVPHAPCPHGTTERGPRLGKPRYFRCGQALPASRSDPAGGLPTVRHGRCIGIAAAFECSGWPGSGAATFAREKPADRLVEPHEHEPKHNEGHGDDKVCHVEHRQSRGRPLRSLLGQVIRIGFVNPRRADSQVVNPVDDQQRSQHHDSDDNDPARHTYPPSPAPVRYKRRALSLPRPGPASIVSRLDRLPPVAPQSSAPPEPQWC